jgi:hypothetical protein
MTSQSRSARRSVAGACCRVTPAAHAPTRFFVETSKSAYAGHHPTRPVTNAMAPITRNTMLTVPGRDMTLAGHVIQAA